MGIHAHQGVCDDRFPEDGGVRCPAFLDPCLAFLPHFQQLGDPPGGDVVGARRDDRFRVGRGLQEPGGQGGLPFPDVRRVVLQRDVIQVVRPQVLGVLEPPTPPVRLFGQPLKPVPDFLVLDAVGIEQQPDIDDARARMAALNTADPGLTCRDHLGCLRLIELRGLPVPLERCTQAPAAYGRPSPCGHRALPSPSTATVSYRAVPSPPIHTIEVIDCMYSVVLVV